MFKDKLQNCSCNQFHYIGTYKQVEKNSMTKIEVEITAVKNDTLLYQYYSTCEHGEISGFAMV